MNENPFFEIWSTPFGAPPFDRIRAAHFPAAFDRGMAEALTDIDSIAANPAAPNFANTIEALERAGGLLTNVGNVFGNLVASLGDDGLQQVERDYAPKLAVHGSKVSLNAGLFARLADLHSRADTLDLAPDARRLLDRSYLGFVRAGAALGPDEKLRMAAINERLAVLHTAFGQNVLHDERDWHLPLAEADLAGLPDFVRDGAHQSLDYVGGPGIAPRHAEFLLIGEGCRDGLAVLHGGREFPREHHGPGGLAKIGVRRFQYFHIADETLSIE